MADEGFKYEWRVYDHPDDLAVYSCEFASTLDELAASLARLPLEQVGDRAIVVLTAADEIVQVDTDDERPRDPGEGLFRVTDERFLDLDEVRDVIDAAEDDGVGAEILLVDLVIDGLIHAQRIAPPPSEAG